MKRAIHGGLEIIPLPRVRPEDIDFGLIHSHFNPEKLPAHLVEQANEILDYLNQKDPPSILAYAQKQKAYNRLLMLWEQMAEVQNKTGPHTVRRLVDTQSGRVTDVYMVQLGIDYCERNYIQAASVIVLEPYDARSRNDLSLQPYYTQGRVLRFDDATQTVHFFPYNKRQISDGNYMVRFEPSPFVYNARERIMNMLLEEQYKYNFLVFPTPLDDHLSKDQYIELRDGLMAKMELSSDRFNLEQRQAIAAIFGADIYNIQNKLGNVLPFILHGPPGTGKTTTLVEACRVIEQYDEHAKILVCTPSNTAADLFAYELISTAKVDPCAIFRLNALMHPISELKECLKDVALIIPNREQIEQFGIPNFLQLVKFRIIVSTLISSIYLSLGGMRERFTHIIIDEAGQASELDSLVPILGLIGPQTKVVLAGDPRQLGPVETLEYFRKNGITSSLIERYESNCNYADDPRVMTMLRNNYRSHPSIIEVPSRLFYNNELRVAEDADPRDALANWTALPKKGFPVFWHHMDSPEQKEMDGHSYMNKGELDIVHNYINKICSELHVKPEDIGVVSPYSCQARKLCHRLEDKYAELTVDTVERFQGSQRRVIIVSTVRSNEKELIGFMMSDKRFNTIITRAEELLIIIGNAKVMAKDPSWRQMLAYCRQNEATINMPQESELPQQIAPTENITGGKEGEEESYEEESDEEEEESEQEDEEELAEKEEENEGEESAEEEEEDDDNDGEEDEEEEDEMDSTSEGTAAGKRRIGPAEEEDFEDEEEEEYEH